MIPQWWQMRPTAIHGSKPAIPFDRRCDSSDRATENRHYVYLYTFACRVESAIKCCGLATVSNNGVPASTTQDGDSRPMRISTGVNSHSNSGISSYSFASASSRMPSSSTFCTPLAFLSCSAPHAGQRQRVLRSWATAFSTCSPCGMRWILARTKPTLGR